MKEIFNPSKIGTVPSHSFQTHKYDDMNARHLSLDHVKNIVPATIGFDLVCLCLGLKPYIAGIS